MRTINRIFVHCTAGPQTLTVAEIQKYWKNHNKWTNPGYHYIIKSNGEIVPLQPEDKPSNGVQGYNSTAINVCYIGGVDNKGRAIDNRTAAQKEALRTILKDLHSRYPDAEILGHRDIWGSNPKNWKKMCPCFNVKEWWNEVNKEPEPEEVQEPIQESEEMVLEQPVVESGEVVVPGEESSHSGNTEIHESRPNPVDFVFEFIKLLFKIIFRIK